MPETPSTWQGWMGGHGQLTLGKVSASDLLSTPPHIPTHISLSIYNYFSKFAIIWAANAYAAILVPETCDANMHTNMLTRHWIQTVLVSTGGPRPGGPATPPNVHSKVLWSWPHMQVPQGHVGGISLSEKAITRSSCCDPPKLWTQIKLPSLQMWDMRASSGSGNVRVWAHSSVGIVTLPGTWCRWPVREMDRFGMLM